MCENVENTGFKASIDGPGDSDIGAPELGQMFVAPVGEDYTEGGHDCDAGVLEAD